MMAFPVISSCSDFNRCIVLTGELSESNYGSNATIYFERLELLAIFVEAC